MEKISVQSPASERMDTAIIGAGQAGLALAYHLAQRGADFVLLEGSDAVGNAWRRRYDSLRLFTPARYSSLPGLPFPGDPDAYPVRDAVADYLERYAAHFALPVRLAQPVTRLTQAESGFRLETPQGEVLARRVVVCTGPFGRLWRPAFAAHLDPQVAQMHAADYRNPAQVPPGPVLVVGAGNSGAWIARELALTHQVSLALGHPPRSLPQRLLGRDLFWWLERLGLERVTPHSVLGQRLRRQEPLIGLGVRDLERSGVELLPRVVGASGHEVQFAGGTARRFATVLWATGYRPEYGWLEAPVLDATGAVLHRNGLSAVPGLAFLGLSWQRSRYSALLGGVGRDAAWLLDQLEYGRAAPGRPGGA